MNEMVEDKWSNAPTPRMGGHPPWASDLVTAIMPVHNESMQTLFVAATNRARALLEGVQLSVLVNMNSIHSELYSNDHKKKVTQLIPYAM